MSGQLAPKGPELQTAAAGGASSLEAQDAQNASPLKDLASAIPSGGSGGSGGGGNSGGGRIQGGTYHPGQGRIMAVDNGIGGNNNGPQPPPAVKITPHPNPPTVINAHVGENPQPDPSRHECSGWDVTKDVGEAIGGPLVVTGSVLGGIAASPLGPAEWATAIGGVLTGGATTIDGFNNLAGCE